MKHQNPYCQHPSAVLSRQLTCLALSVAVAFTPLSAAFAQVVPDPNAGQYRPGQTSAGNGVPVVNITAPSSSGVSRNQYHQFNVQQQGLILNNSVINTQTQLGGWIQGNPNLPYGAARVILNEVTSGNPSLLRGYIEVGGQRAEVIIANPAGISVDGAGFINAAGVTLTTGTPVFNNSGNLESYRVGGGRVSIGGAGLDTSTADYTRIIARAVEINSGLWANDLSIAAGTGTFAPDGTPIQLTELTVEDASGKPLYAIDVAQLGGMYAGKIRLIGTEAGVGVRNSGHIGASAGQVTVTADGMLVNSGTINSSHSVAGSSGIQVAAASGISNTGSLYTQGQLVLNSNGQLDNQGTLAALGNVSLNAQNIHNTADGLIAAGMATDGSFDTQGQLNATAQQLLSNQGQILSGANTTLQANTLTNTSATIHAGKDLNITADTIHNQQADLLASGNLHIQGLNPNTSVNSQLNNQNGLISAAGQAQISTGSIDNSAGVIISGGNLAITTGDLNGAGQILTEANADITVQGDYTAEAGNQIIADGNLLLNVDGTLTNAGDILAGNTASITAHSIDNLSGGEISAGTNQITATGTNAGTFTNRGLIDGILTYITADALTNLGSGRIYGNHIGIQAGTLTNRDENNQSAVIAARERMDIGAATLTNLNNAVIFSAGDMSIGGSLDENHIAQGRANLVYNDGAVIEALDDMQIAAASIENRNTVFQSEERAQSSQDKFIHIIGQYLFDNEDIVYFSEGAYGDYSFQIVGKGSDILSTIALIGESSHYFLMLPSSKYPMADYPYLYQRGGLPFAALDDDGNPANYEPETTQLWQTFGIPIPSAKPGQPATICNGSTTCNNAQQQAYDQYLSDYTAWQDSNRSLYQQLNDKIFDFNADFLTRKISMENLREYTETRYSTEVTASNPGQISAAGSMLLDGNLVNDKSRITAGSIIATTGNVQTIDATGVNYVERIGSEISTIRTASGRSWTPPVAVNERDAASQYSLIVATPQPNTTVQGSGTQIGNTPVVQLPNGDLIQAASPNTRIPASSLYQINPGSSKNYLIETDPRFASYGTWLTSDYMLAALGLDPAATQKRLGDGFYEQQLIREQIGQLTGYRYLAGYLSDEAQYQALMNAGVQFAQEYNLTVGVTLTAEQMAQLTGDIVWLVSTEVTLPDGSTETVLVPQLYTRGGTSMITAGGSLISANNVYITSAEGNPITLNNNATIAGREGLFVDVAYLQNRIGQLHGGDVVLRSATDIDNIGGTISGDNSITLAAARDINIASTVVDGYDINGQRNGIGNIGSVYLSGRQVLASEQPPEQQPAAYSAQSRSVSSDTTTDTTTSEPSGSNQGQILLSAGRDINLRAGYIGNDATVSTTTEDGSQTTVGGSTNLVAGRNIDLSTVTTEHQQTLNFDARNSRAQASRAEVGSQIQGTGDINLIADGNLHLRASGVQSDSGTMNAAADTIHIEAGEAQQSWDASYYAKFNGTLGSSSYDNRYNITEGNLIGSTLSAEQINLQSRGDTTIQASSVVATHDINLSSEQGNINIVSGTSTRHTEADETTKRSGIFTSGASLTVGNQKTATTDTVDNSYAVASTVGSLQGDVNILAQQGSYNQVGSDLLALQGDINVVAQDINILEARETSQRYQTYEYQQSGLTLGVSSPIISAGQYTQQMSDAADRTSDSRMQALAAGAAALNIANNASDIMDNAQGIGDALSSGDIGSAGLQLSVSIGSTKAQSQTLQQSDSAKGSTLNAGGNINLIATGNPNPSTGKPDTTQGSEEKPTYSGGNILIQGSDITAGQNIVLAANDQINIRAAANTATESSSNKSNSGALGVTIGSNIGITASASQGSGNSHTADNSWTYSHVSADDTLTLISGGDTNIIGAQVAGNTVRADIGGDLNIQTLQDTSLHHSQQSSGGGSLTIGTGLTGIGGTVSSGKSHVDGNYASAQEYAGIMAGDGGFDITVAGNTDLKGAIIASTQAAVDDNKNQLTTGSLTISQLANNSNYDAKGSSIGIGYNTSNADTNLADKPGMQSAVGALSGNSVGYASDSGSDSSITIAGISTGSITITNEEEQQRRTGQTAEEAIAAINDSVRTGQSVNGIDKNWDAQQLMDDMQAGAEITAAFGQQASQGVGNFATAKVRQALSMMAQADLLEATDPQAATELRTQAQEMYGNWKEGGAYRVLAHTIVGGLSGDWSGAAGAGSSALIAGQLDDLTADLPPGVKEAVGAGVSAGLGYLTGGEQGATTAFNTDANNRQLHVDEIAWIKRHAQEFANQQGISEEEATSILARQALMQIDWVWYEKFGGKDAYNTQAAAFLSGAGTLSEGDATQQMFTATGDQYTRPYLFAEDVHNSGNLSFYEQYVIRDSDKSTSQVMLENEWRGLTGLPQGLWDKWSAYQGEREGVAWLLSGPTFLFDTLYMDAIGKPFANAVENPQVIAERIQAGAEGVKAIGGELTPGPSLLSQIYGDNTVLLSGNLAVADAALPVAGIVGVGKAGQLVGKELLSNTGSKTVRPSASSESTPSSSNANASTATPLYLSNSTAPEVQARLNGLAAEARQGLPPNKGNVAVAEINIPELADQPFITKAFSGYQTDKDGFVGKPSGNVDTWALQPQKSSPEFIGGPGAYFRDVDTEFKILENLAQKLGPNTNATGTVNLISEKVVCPSCTTVIMQFRERYPNIQLNIFTRD
ncbi:tRNA nuclease CdiA [Saezia sanguinis]|uniref:tRNA nuclease CdiA n=1 Tax=Saezia sanguinis TaxID=1965230 RepID=A0A433SEU4_9BURK|nr:hemagglutinin repeat-containing protein [Saezia sanguinis]RUS67271.1 tRNA nuclease CdiA [Saezia sanguinis]